MRLPALGLLLSLSANLLHAQGVLIAPHAVFIDPRTRSGWIQLHNPGATPAEVSVETLFGYPVTDSAGKPLAGVRVFNSGDGPQPAVGLPAADEVGVVDAAGIVRPMALPQKDKTVNGGSAIDSMVSASL